MNEDGEDDAQMRLIQDFGDDLHDGPYSAHPPSPDIRQTTEVDFMDDVQHFEHLDEPPVAEIRVDSPPASVPHEKKE